MNDPTTSEETAPRRPGAAPAPHRAPPTALPAQDPDFDWIVCDGCGRMFNTFDGPGMIAAIKGPCPDCGGAFELLGRVATRTRTVLPKVREADKH